MINHHFDPKQLTSTFMSLWYHQKNNETFPNCILWGTSFYYRTIYMYIWRYMAIYVHVVFSFFLLPSYGTICPRWKASGVALQMRAASFSVLPLGFFQLKCPQKSFKIVQYLWICKNQILGVHAKINVIHTCFSFWNCCGALWFLTHGSQSPVKRKDTWSLWCQAKSSVKGDMYAPKLNLSWVSGDLYGRPVH